MKKNFFCILICVFVLASTCSCHTQTDSLSAELNQIYEVISPSYSHLGVQFDHSNIISSEKTYTIDASATREVQKVICGSELTFEYEKTVTSGVSRKSSLIYTVNRDKEKKLYITSEGKLSKIAFDFAVIDMPEDGDTEKIRTLVEEKIHDLIDVSAYANTEIDTSDSGFGLSYFNSVGGCVTDWMRVYVNKYGELAVLTVGGVSIDLDDFTIDEEKVERLINAKCSAVYNTDNTEYVSYTETPRRGIVVRDGVTYVGFAVYATYRMDGRELSDFTIRIMIPLDMVKA